MNILLKYFQDLSPIQIKQFTQLSELYSYWNAKINLISRKDIENLYEHHVLHSLSLAKIISFSESTSVLDVGTGGGFPGIPLAIFFPKANFVLIDSIGKKIRVVNEIIREIELVNTTAVTTRAENFTKKFDFVTGRAVSSFPEFIRTVKKNISDRHSNSLPNGIFYLKGGDINNEPNNLKKNIKIYNISDFFEEKYFREKIILHY